MAKVVHRNWSDDHCNLSDTLTSILLLELCKNKINGYLERLTCTGPKCLHILYMYRLSKCKACSTNAHPHMHACMHVHMHAHTQAHAHIHLLPNTLFSSPSRTHMNAHTHTRTCTHTAAFLLLLLHQSNKVTLQPVHLTDCWFIFQCMLILTGKITEITG